MDKYCVRYLLLFTVLFQSCVSDSPQVEFWNKPCGDEVKETRVARVDAQINITERVDRFLHDERLLHGLRDHLKLFMDAYTHENNTRVHLKKRQLLNKGMKRLQAFLPDHQPTSQTSQVMVNMYTDLSYMSVFLTQAQRNEQRHERGHYAPDIRHFLKKLKGIQCDLAQMIWDDGKYQIPVVHRSVLGQYSNINDIANRNEFIYMVTRDSLNRLRNITRDFDLSSWDVEEEYFQPTPLQSQENTISAPMLGYFPSSDSQNVPFLVEFGLTVCGLVLLLGCIFCCKCYRKAGLVSPIEDEEAHL